MIAIIDLLAVFLTELCLYIPMGCQSRAMFGMINIYPNKTLERNSIVYQLVYQVKICISPFLDILQMLVLYSQYSLNSPNLNIYLKTFRKLPAELNALIQGSKFGSHCNLKIEIFLEYQNSEERMFSA